VTTIALAMFPDLEELDLVGPWEVLAAWSHGFPDDDVSVFTMAAEPGVVRCAKGLRILPDHTYEDAPAYDILLYPGGQGTRRQLGDETVRAFVRAAAERTSILTSVCTGALVYADAGLLDRRPATTHHGALDLLATLGRDIDVRPDERFVDDGDIVTAAGVSAGIDMALHLVARLHSPERAREVKRFIQYDPQPPV
jgi:transcriptional regulator GlxA family with amidase domain